MDDAAECHRDGSHRRWNPPDEEPADSEVQTVCPSTPGGRAYKGPTGLEYSKGRSRSRHPGAPFRATFEADLPSMGSSSRQFPVELQIQTGVAGSAVPPNSEDRRLHL